MDDLRLRWAERIRQARIARGLTQQDLAEATGVTQAQISLWESGGSIPRDPARIALADALELKVRELFPYPDDDDEPNGDREAA